MRLLTLLLCVSMVYLSSCSNSTDKQEELTPEEKLATDSISRAQQKMKTDSLKKTNPLLIMPPDSTYTGDYTDKYPGGITKFKGYFRFGKRHGQWMSFYPNGEVWSEMHYDRGLREGPNNAWFENKKLRYAGFFKQDRQDSIWTYYDTLGKVAEKVLFKNDRVIKRLPF